MRRVAPIAFVAAFAVAALAVTAAGGDSDEYRVAATFDSSSGLVAGQQVKVAGAVVGKIDNVRLVPGPKALVEMRVDRRFAPFRGDARCQILPEGLISENYVECDPGTPGAPALPSRPGAMATVPLERTAVPTSLQDLLNVFSLPTGQRLRILLTELGIATAARGEDINALLRRSNPALDQTHAALEVIAAQRHRLAEAITQTDRVVAELADRRHDVRSFVRRSARVARTTAPRRAALEQSIQRLPRLLRAARPSLRAIDRAAAAGRPLLADLHAAAPHLVETTKTIPGFSRAGDRALAQLAPALRTTRRSLQTALPVVRHLDRAATESVPFAGHLAPMLASTRDKGGFEGLLRIVYGIATSMSAYDKVSHFVGFISSVLPACVADADAPGCNANYYAPRQGTVIANDPDCRPASVAPWAPPTDCRPSAQRKRKRRPSRPQRNRPSRRPNAPDVVAEQPSVPNVPVPDVSVPKVPLPRLPLPGLPLPKLPLTDHPSSSAAEQLLDFLLGP